MPNFVDYSTENMNGTPVHTFLDENGQASPPMYGDQADALAAGIDQFKQFRAANAGPDMRVAGPGGGIPEDSTMTGSGQLNQSAGPAAAPEGPNQSVAPSSPSTPQREGGAAPSYSAEDAQREQAAREAEQAAAIHKAAASGNLIAGQNDPGAFINAPVQGTSRRQLQARAAGSVAVPKTGEETVEGAAPYDQDAAEERANADIDMRLAKQKQAEMLQARAERDAAMFDQQAAIAAAKLQHEQQKQQLVEDGVQQDYATAREFRDRVAKQQVDPNRLFSGDRGAFNTIAAVIGQGLGAFAAAGGGTNNFRNNGAQSQNFAKEIIDGAIDRDIRAQEVNIRNGQEASNSQLNDIYRRLGDMNQAKAVLRSMQQDYAGIQMKALAARDGSADAQNAYEQWEAANAADRAEQERKFQADAYGKHTIKIAQQYVQPGGGGPPSLDLQLKRARALGELGQLGNQGASQQAELDLKRSEAAKNNAEAAKSGTDASYNSEVEPVDTALTALDALAQKYGYSVDPRTGKFSEGASSGSGFPRDIVPGVDTPTTGNFKKELANVNTLHSIAMTGNKRANPEQAEATGAKAGVLNDTTREQLENMRANLIAKKASLGTGTTPRARAMRAGQRVQVGVENNQAAASDDIREE